MHQALRILGCSGASLVPHKHNLGATQRIATNTTDFARASRIRRQRNGAGAGRARVPTSAYIYTCIYIHIYIHTYRHIYADLGAGGAVDNANGVAVIGIPVGDLAVGARGEELGLVGVIEHSLEEGGRKERVVAGEAAHVPDNARPVAGRRHKLEVVVAHLQAVDGRLVLLRCPRGVRRDRTRNNGCTSAYV